MKDNSNQPPSPAAFHILLALAEGDLHGYGIMQQIKHMTDGAFVLGPGTLYRSLKHMLEIGWITEAGDRIDPALDDERRRYYKLTTTGRKIAQTESERLAALVRLAHQRQLLGDLS
jgi:DNA-binding PadR family transcriptional regulator